MICSTRATSFFVTISLCCLSLPLPTVAFTPVRGTNVALQRDFQPPLLTSFSSVPKTKSSSSSSSLFAKKKERAKGVYVRPSGAIERGSGFFVPGLEGPRVRLLFGVVLLVLTTLNHILTMSDSNGLTLEESIAILYGLLVLFQAAIEFGKEELIVEGGSSTASRDNTNNNGLKKEDLIQQWSQSAATTVAATTAGLQSRIQWCAASYLAVTPATQLLLLQKDSILYRLSSLSNKQDDDSATDDERVAVEAALNQLEQSKGGRIALPLTHPAAALAVVEDARTIVLQRITDDSCFMMISDQLLASFTKDDLKWLGQMAQYVSMEM